MVRKDPQQQVLLLEWEEGLKINSKQDLFNKVVKL